MVLVAAIALSLFRSASLSRMVMALSKGGAGRSIDVGIVRAGIVLHPLNPAPQPLILLPQLADGGEDVGRFILKEPNGFAGVFRRLAHSVARFFVVHLVARATALDCKPVQHVVSDDVAFFGHAFAQPFQPLQFFFGDGHFVRLQFSLKDSFIVLFHRMHISNLTMRSSLPEDYTNAKI